MTKELLVRDLPMSSDQVVVSGTFGNQIASFSPEYAALPASNALASIDWGTQVSDTSVNVYFGTAGFSADGYTSEGFNAYEIAQFQAAFTLIENATQLSFNIVGTAAAADFQLILDTNEMGGSTLGYFNPPGTYNEGVGVFNGATWDRGPGGDLSVGGYGFVTIVHELLHGLGMAHPHDTGGSSVIMDGVGSAFGDSGTYGLNQGLFTTMSYNSGYLDGSVGTAGAYGSWGYEAGPMALDMAVLQDKYGTNTTFAAGDNVYLLPDGNATGTFWSAIWDTGGTDEIRYVGTTNVTIDLRAATLLDEIGGGGWVSAADGTAGGYTIANGVVIENASGGRGFDTITGNNGANVLKGGGRKDTLHGGDGDDRVYGQGGNDFIYGDGGNDRLLGGNGKDRLFGGSGDDRMFGHAGNDRLYGGSGDDKLLGHDGDDRMYGQGGRDILTGGSGDDILSGGGGRDTFVFVANADEDRILDFNVGTDRLRIDSSYWAGETDATAFVAAHASVTAQGVEFDFGGGDILILEGLTTTVGLDAFLFIG